MSDLGGTSVVITGGTGSFGRAFAARLLKMEPSPARICILSRDEYKQAVMRAEFRDDHRLRFFLGDVRDYGRLETAFRGADVVVAAAAMKQVPACEYNVLECVKTNVTGSTNIVEAAIACGVRKVVALSTDKACQPCTTYGFSKAMMERVMVDGNSMAGIGPSRFSCTRYGNVQDSRMSVVPVWRKAVAAGEPLQITDPAATRFHMTQSEAVDLVLLALREMEGGEIFVPKLRAYRLGMLALAVAPGHPIEVTGLRVGEKMHESLISPDEVRLARDYGDHFRVLPAAHSWRNGEAWPGGKPIPAFFQYRSDSFPPLNVDELRRALDA